MRAKEYLGQIRRYDVLIENKTETVARLREQATSITVKSDKVNVKTTARHDKLEATIAKIIDLENGILKDIERLTELKDEVTRVIDAVNDADLINILYKRYVHYEEWTAIADEMNFSEQHVLRLHGKALQKVQNIINQDAAAKSCE